MVLLKPEFAGYAIYIMMESVLRITEDVTLKRIRCLLQNVKKYMNTFSAFLEEHTYYEGKDIEYFDARLDVKTMHSMFEDKYPDFNIKYKFYLTHFNENVSLRFSRPQVDTCKTCEELTAKIKQSNLSENAKRSLINDS